MGKQNQTKTSTRKKAQTQAMTQNSYIVKNIFIACPYVLWSVVFAEYFSPFLIYTQYILSNKVINQLKVLKVNFPLTQINKSM